MHRPVLWMKPPYFMAAAAAALVAIGVSAPPVRAAGEVHVPQAGSSVSVVYVRQVHGYSRQILDTNSNASGQGAHRQTEAGTARRVAPQILEFEAPARNGADMLPVPRVVVP